MKKGSSKSKRKTEEEKREDEVEKMLQAAQDEILMNLSLNSHIARASPSAEKLKGHEVDVLQDLDLDLDLDLQRRFQALKTKSNSSHLQPQQDQELEHDLSARFAALKSKSSSVGSTAVSASNCYDEEESEDEETQVQKLIEWAKDAARLDPSPPSDHQPDT